MTKITIDEQEFDTKDFTDEQNNIVAILNLGQNSELKNSLGIEDKPEDKK